jgi:hypothetical protein
MPNPTRIEINCSTGIESIIELTDAEIAEMEAAATIAEQQREEADAAAAAKLAAKEAVLAKLGLTPEEAAALLA